MLCKFQNDMLCITYMFYIVHRIYPKNMFSRKICSMPNDAKFCVCKCHKAEVPLPIYLKKHLHLHLKIVV